jgi:hypothetical protein
MRKSALLLLVLFCVIAVSAQSTQSYVSGKILKWDVEANGKHGKAAVYYLQVGKTVYRITRGTTKPEVNLAADQNVQCRIDNDRLFVAGEKGKEVKYSIIGATEAP